MTQEVIYTCDKCKNIIKDPQSPIMVTVIIQNVMLVERDFCSTKCTEQWTKEDLEKKVRTYAT